MVVVVETIRSIVQGRRPPAFATSPPRKHDHGYNDGDLGTRRRRPDDKKNDDEDGDDTKKKFSFADYMIGTTGFQGPSKMWEAPYKLLKVRR